MKEFASAALPWILFGLAIALAAVCRTGHRFENSYMTPGGLIGFALGLLLSACGLLPLNLGIAGGMLAGLLAGALLRRPFPPKEQLDRIAEMETLFDRVQADLAAQKQPDPKAVQTLKDYYTSTLWKKDYAADEQGLLPTGLKRGVLSQDGVHDLLTRLKEREK